MSSSPQALFKKIVLANKLLDETTVDKLLRAVPEPERAIAYLVKKQILAPAKAKQVLALYRKHTNEGDSRQSPTSSSPSQGTSKKQERSVSHKADPAAPIAASVKRQSISIACECGKDLVAPLKLAGKHVKCPNCANRILAPVGARTEASQPCVETLSHQSKAATGEDTAAKAFAAAAGIDLSDRATTSFEDSESAAAYTESLLAQMPAVESAYKTSGRITAAAATAFIAVNPLTILVTSATAVIAWVIAAGGLILFAFIPTAIAEFQLKSGALATLFSFIAIFLVPLATLCGHAAAFYAIGWISAKTTDALGRQFKNRSKTLEIALSVIPVLFAVAILSYTAVSIESDMKEPGKDPHFMDVMFPHAFFGPLRWNLFGFMGLTIGTAISLFVAIAKSIEAVESAKFCESCNQYVKAEDLRKISLGGGKAVVAALKRNNLKMASSLMRDYKGRDCLPQLSVCKQCGNGFFEVLVDFKTTWSEDAVPKESEKSWLVASVPVMSNQLPIFDDCRKRKSKQLKDESARTSISKSTLPRENDAVSASLECSDSRSSAKSLDISKPESDSGRVLGSDEIPCKACEAMESDDDMYQCPNCSNKICRECLNDKKWGMLHGYKGSCPLCGATCDGRHIIAFQTD